MAAYYLLAIIVGYLLGCSNMSYYIGKIKGVDMKGNGSKNFGTCNTFVLAGAKAGMLVFIHDFLKSFLAVLLLRLISNNVPYVGLIAGCAAVVGHIFPFYLKFDGGKGFAPFIGLAVATYPKFALIALIVSIIFALITDYIVASTFSMIIAIPAYSAILHDFVGMLIILAISALIIFKHKNNIVNLITNNGKEMRISASIKKKKGNGR